MGYSDFYFNHAVGLSTFLLDYYWGVQAVLKVA